MADSDSTSEPTEESPESADPNVTTPAVAPQSPDAETPPEDPERSTSWVKEDPAVRTAPTWVWPMINRTIRRILLIGFILYVGYWLVGQAGELLVVFLVAAFLALAILPGVDGIVRRLGWSRGLATVFVIAVVFIGITVLVGFLIPALADASGKVGGQIPNWLNDARRSGVPVPILNESNQQIMANLEAWLRKEGGTHVLSVASSGVGLAAKLFLVLVFTIIIASSEPNLLRAVLGRLRPANQERFLDAWRTAIQQTGGYFYSRLLLMLFTSTGTFIVMTILGVPAKFALPLAVFGAFFVEFIPLVGGYIGIALPVLFVLVEQTWVHALVLLVWALIYQQIHDYLLSPRISSKTMSISAGVALGSALLGGAIAGPIGALFAMPVAGIVTAFIRKYAPSHVIEVDPEVRPHERKPRRHKKSKANSTA